jgi:septal ring factor EnvC (AmiA/AmiB activator)
VLLLAWLALPLHARAGDDRPAVEPGFGGVAERAPAERLQDLRDELAGRRVALRDLDDQARSLLDGFGELDETLARLDDEAERTRLHLERLRADVRAVDGRVAEADTALRRSRRRLEGRLRGLYVTGEGGAVRALLGAEGFTELALRRRYLRVLAENDRKIVEDVERAQSAVAAEQQRRLSAVSEVELTAKLIDEQRRLIQDTRRERSAALARLTQERDLARRAARELERRKQELTALVLSLADEAKRRAPQTPASRRGILRGALLAPVAGTVLRKFGSVVDKDSGAEIVSNGIEVRAEQGTEVVAVADGRVAHVGWVRGFGRLVIVDHGEGHHTLSAHLSRFTVAVGDAVRRGQTIGFVGDTESQNGPKLYFELRENGRPKNPLPFLR